MNQFIPISGAGGGGSPHTPSEAKNTLRSGATIRVLEAISQGEIVGLVDGAKSIFFNDTPVQNANGTYNFERFTLEERVGLPSQPYMTGFPSVESTNAVNAQIDYGTPITYTTVSPDTDACRVTIAIPQLSQTTKDGDLVGNSIQFTIEVASDGGAFVNALSAELRGKTMALYERDYRVERPAGTGNWSIRVIRQTPDDGKANTANNIILSRVTEIQDVKLSYDNIAYLGLSIDAQATGGTIPTRSYRVKGLIVDVPNNYNPITRAYTGIWNGTFKREWSDNPVWLLYAVLTNPRYGMGEYITANEIDKFSFYDAAVYCDELVPTGSGGAEPRFTWNCPIMGSQDAIKAIQDIAGSFNAALVKEGPLYRLIQDRPADPVAIVTNANVIDGMFNYASTALDQRVTVANVTYNDKLNRWKQDIETVEADETSLERYGYVATDIIALGATTPGQAMRAGKWFLESQLSQKDMCSFAMSFNGMALRLGDIIEVFDQDYTSVNNQGRAVNITDLGSDLYRIELDREVDISIINSTFVYFSGQDSTRYEGTYEQTLAPIIKDGSTHSVIDVQLPAAQTPPAIGDVWFIEEVIASRQFKIVGITHQEKNIISFSCLEHDPNKYSRVELGLDVPAPVYAAINTNQIAAPINLTFTPNNFLNDGVLKRNLVVSWESNSTLAVRFTIRYRVNNGNWTERTIFDNNYEIFDLVEGDYDFQVVAHSVNGTSSVPLTGTYTFVISGGTGSLLSPVTDLQIKGTAGGTAFSTPDLTVEWTNPTANNGELATLKDFFVRVSDTGANILREEYISPVAEGEKQYFDYTFAKNRFDGGPRRSLVIAVFARDTNLKLSTGVTQTFTNAVPAAPTISVIPGVKSLMIDVQPGTTIDHAGTVIHASTTSGFTPSGANLIYKGSAPFFIKEDTTESWYFRAAHYDTFGDTGLNYSSENTGTPSTAGGIPSGTTLPANPSEINGELAFFLDVADAATRGIYGWDGSTWKFTRDGANLIVNSVAADKLAVANLAAISANMGTITAGNITLDTAGFVRTSGATAFGTGTGIWTGYDSGAYKWRAGTPGGARAEWNGSAFNIYNASNQLTISSGNVDYTYVANKSGFAAISQITSGNASTFIANAAINSAQIGSLALVGTSNFSVKSAVSGARMEMDSQAIKVFDAGGVKRVQLGYLLI